MSAMNEPSDAMLRQWLLQQLPPDQAALLEEQLMRDDALLDRLRDAATDLLDAAASAALEAAALKAFRTHRLPAQRQRFRAAQAWARLNAAPPRAAARRRFAIGLAIAAALLIAVVSWNHWLPAPPPDDVGVQHYTLLAAADRGAPTSRLQLPGSAVRIHLQLEVPAAAPPYTLFVETQGRREILAGHLSPRTAGPYTFVETDVDVTPIAPGIHRLVLAGQGAVGPEHSWEMQVGAR